MRMDPYRKSPHTKKFNNKYIIQLLNNYRSHLEIIRYPSDVFYDGTIIHKAKRSKILLTYNGYTMPFKFIITFYRHCMPLYQYGITTLAGIPNRIEIGAG